MSERYAIVHWAIGNASGHGNPMPSATARAFVEAMNERHGAGTHWVGWDLSFLKDKTT